jgi:hypothetical protein
VCHYKAGRLSIKGSYKNTRPCGMKFSIYYITKNAIWLTLPPLIFSLGLMAIAATALTPIEFNAGIPDVLIKGEMIGRILVFALPLFFSIGISTKTQKTGLALYCFGVAAYCLTYGTQNYFPDSAWSTSMIGFTASAYTNLLWMAGLGFMGEKFYPLIRLPYSPIFYIIPATLFIILHTTHAVLYFRLIFQ